MPTSEQKTKPRSQRNKPEAGSSVIETLTNAYVNWVSEQQAALLEYQKRCAEAYFEMISKLQQLMKDASKPVEDAQRSLMLKGAAAQADKEKMQEYQDSYQEFVKTLPQLSNSTEFQEAYQNAYSAFQQAQQEAWEQAQERTTKAYQEFIKALKAAWNEVDPEKPDPAIMRLIEWSTKVAARPAA